MTKAINCADLGMDCGFRATAETIEELMGKVSAHAKEVHDMESIPPELAEKAMSVVREI